MALFNLDKEWLFANQVTEELVKRIIDNTFNLYKVSPDATKVNIYGETVDTIYAPAIQIYGIFTRQPQENIEGEHGTNMNQKV